MGDGTDQGIFRYDPLGRRQNRQAGGATRQYLYDRLDIVQEVTDAGVVDYLRSLAIDEPLVRAAAEFYLIDGSGSVLALTQASGGLATRYTYEPFGRTQAEGLPSANPFQFTGRENDGIAGLYAYRRRFHHPGLHRFLSEDPLRLRDPRTTRYGYGRNNPITFADPLGLFEVNLLVGTGATAVVGPFGAEISIGLALTFNISSLTDINLTGNGFVSSAPVSPGRGGGFNIGGDVFGGYLLGPLEGETLNVNAAAGPFSGTVFLDPNTGQPLGGTFGTGPTLGGAGASITLSTTRVTRPSATPVEDLAGEFPAVLQSPKK